MLADFRSQGADAWDALLTQIVGSLLAQDLVSLKRVAQDGMRVRASAGASSFRHRPRLEQALIDACEQVEALVDGGFATLDTINKADKLGCTVFSPLREEEKQLAAGKNPYEPKYGDSEAVASWRERMGTTAAKAIYRLRGQTAEWVNAVARNHGLYHMPVRGEPKCRTIGLLHAIAHNILRGVALCARAAVATEST